MQPKIRHTRLWRTLVKLLGVMLLGGTFWIILSSCAPIAVPTGTAPASVTPAPATIAPYPGPSEVVATPNQQATQDAVTTIVALKHADATTAVFQFTSSPYPTSPLGQTGIHEGDEYTKLEMLKVGLKVENSWGGVVDGNKVSVWAGALTTDTTQGVIHVIYIYPSRTWEQRFLTTEKHGSLHITMEQNNRLTLLASDGTTFYFDVPGLTFTSSPTEAVSTATPPPTYTPVTLPTPVPIPSGYPQSSPSGPTPATTVSP